MCISVVNSYCSSDIVDLDLNLHVHLNLNIHLDLDHHLDLDLNGDLNKP
jgi:hypothetical protein